MHTGDSLIIFMIIIAIALWVWLMIKRWLAAPLKMRYAIKPDKEILVDDAVALLESQGYEVLTEKRRIPIKITLNDDDLLQSRLFVDHFARDDKDVYIVKVARERKPIELTGSSLRDHLLAFHLVYPEAGGILYVDPRAGRIHKIEFKVEHARSRRRTP